MYILQFHKYFHKNVTTKDQFFAVLHFIYLFYCHIQLQDDQRILVYVQFERLVCVFNE